MHARGVGQRRLVLDRDGHSCAEVVLGALTLGGSRSLGRPDAVIREGAPADLCAIDLRSAAAAGVPPLEALAWNADPSWVSDVWVAGRRRVQDRQVIGAEEVVRQALPYLGPG
jgi:cytosine/adenosine deaminase-related metal-dependent hydrolase